MPSTTQYIQAGVAFPNEIDPNVIINTSIECMHLDDVKLIARDSDGDVHDLISGFHYTVTGTRNEGDATTTNVVITLTNTGTLWSGTKPADIGTIDLIAYRETDLSIKYIVRLGYSNVEDINVVSEASRLRDEEALHYGIKVVGFDTKKVLKIFDTDRDYYYGYDDTGAPVLLTQDDFRDSIVASIDLTIAEIEAARDEAEASALAAATSETNSAASALAAATSETNSAASALAAATSETNSATSETNSATSALAAATSEANSAASALAAAASAALLGVPTWGDYALNVEYTGVETAIAGATVLTCTLDATTIYRSISTAVGSNGYPTQDAFYSSFDGTNTSDILATRGEI